MVSVVAGLGVLLLVCHFKRRVVTRPISTALDETEHPVVTATCVVAARSERLVIGLPQFMAEASDCSWMEYTYNIQH